MIDNVKDEKRALKMKQMRVRQHNKRCSDPAVKKIVDLGRYDPQMNGSYVCGQTSRLIVGASGRELIREQFKIDIPK